MSEQFRVRVGHGLFRKLVCYTVFGDTFKEDETIGKSAPFFHFFPTMKKIFTLILLSMIAFNAIHAEITWTFSDDGTMIVSGTGDMDDNPFDIYERAKIKKVVIENGITSIKSCAFMYCHNLISVSIPNSVTTIKEAAFCYCYNLNSVTIPKNVISIEGYAFYNCSNLISVIVEEGNTMYDSRNECNAIIETKSNTLIVGCRNTIIPNTVKSIGYGAFFGCSGLTSITIPESVTDLGGWAFSDCQDLISIIVEKGNKTFDSRNNCNAIIETKSNTLVQGCKCTIIPNTVTSIGGSAFQYCYNLTSITIPNSVKKIESNAFNSCSGLTSLTIPESVTSIGEDAFSYCLKLNEIVFSSSVITLGKGCFGQCSSLSQITCNALIPPSVDANAFIDTKCQLGTLYVPSSVVSLYKEANGWKEWKNIQPIPTSYAITDGETYTNESEADGYDISYTRNFNNTKWQALYIPFSLEYNDWKNVFDVAYINGIRQLDKNDDGVIDETIMDIIKIKSGATTPNTPYLIRAKSIGEYTLSVNNATLYKAEENSVDCRTTIAEYTFTGTYKTIPSATLIANQYYAMGGGELIISDGSNDLKPYRWYMKAESRNSFYSISNGAKVITINVVGDEETTGVKELRITNDKLPIYDLNGRKVNENNQKPGMYIKNGKKVVIK